MYRWFEGWSLANIERQTFPICLLYYTTKKVENLLKGLNAVKKSGGSQGFGVADDTVHFFKA